MFRKLFALILLSFLLAVPIAAENDAGFGEMIENAPPEATELLPEEFFEGSPESAARGLEKLLEGRYFGELLGDLLLGGLESAMPALMSLFSVLVVSALLSTFKESLKSEALSGAVGLASAAALTVILVRSAAAHIEAVEGFLQRLSQLCLAMLPVMGSVLAMGGSGGAAAATNGGFLMILGVMEAVVGEAFGSIVGVSLALCAANIFSAKFRLAAIARAVRRSFGIFFGAVMSLLGFVVSLKIGIASAGDSMAMRGAKMFASNAIPLVGAAIGGTFGTLATALSYIKSISGAVGILLIFLLALPTFLTVWMYRCGLVLLSGAAEMLGCDRERELLSGVVSVYGYMLAVVAVSAVIFILLLTLFMRSTLAFGGVL